MDLIVLVRLAVCCAVLVQVVTLGSAASLEDAIVSMKIARPNANKQSIAADASRPTTTTKGTTFNIMVNMDTALGNTGPRFVGITLDSSVFRRKWKTFDVHSTVLQVLARGLSPSFLRVGGSAADFFIFNPTPAYKENSFLDDNDTFVDYEDPDVDKPRIENYTVTGQEWERLNYLVSVAGWDMIFDFNEFLRVGDRWDPDNARKLLKFSSERNYSIPCFQLGNEPNLYFHNFKFRIPGSKLAKDMKQLRSLLSQFAAYNHSCILGPDVTKVTLSKARSYLQEFLQTGGQKVVSAVTLHHYYPSSIRRYPTLNDFINITTLNSLKQELSVGTSLAHSLAPGLPVWLSETSSVIGGGLAGISTGYAAGFMWLDKLGLSSQYGLKAVLRQCLYNGYYALISNNFTPYPDYFLTVLYKRLVQGSVFKVPTSTDSVRVYASCTNPTSGTYQKGALTVYILNVKNEPTTFNLTQFHNQQYELYLLTPGDDQGLHSPSVALNGKKLEMVDQKLPPLRPLLCSGTITFPAYSLGFVVIPKANTKLCMS